MNYLRSSPWHDIPGAAGVPGKTEIESKKSRIRYTYVLPSNDIIIK